MNKILYLLTLGVLMFGYSLSSVSAKEPTVNNEDTSHWKSVFVSNPSFLESELVYPPVSSLPASAGKRVAITPADYAGTQVHHMLYLPSDWQSDWKDKQLTWPIIAEYTGNYFPAAGSTGQVEDSHLGFGISGGQFIWVTLPFISEDLSENAKTWWGDEQATIDYAKKNVPKICEEFGGDARRVFLCGFSRGAIATNYIGLHDDEIAKLWCGFITHDHYDGEREWTKTSWGTPLAEYRSTAKQRLDRLGNRPVLICQNGSTDGIRNYLEQQKMSLDQYTFLNVNTTNILGKFPNEFAIHPHNDVWLKLDSPERRKVWAWIHQTLQR